MSFERDGAKCLKVLTLPPTFSQQNVGTGFNPVLVVLCSFKRRVFPFQRCQLRVVPTPSYSSIPGATGVVHSLQASNSPILLRSCPDTVSAPHPQLQRVGPLPVVGTQATCQNAGTLANTYRICTAGCSASECPG